MGTWLARTSACSAHVAWATAVARKWAAVATQVGASARRLRVVVAAQGGGMRVRVALAARVGQGDWGRHRPGDWVWAVAARGGVGRPRDGTGGLTRGSGGRGGLGGSGRR